MRPEFRHRPRITHDLGIAARIAGRATGRRLRGETLPFADDATFRAALAPWVAKLPTLALVAHGFHYLPAKQPPWYDTGLDLAEGDEVTLLADGRVYLSRLLDLWVPPSFQLWCRIGPDGPVFRGTRSTHSFIAPRAGRLWLANYFPGEWTNQQGTTTASASDYSKLTGGTSVLILKWAPGAQVTGLLRSAAPPQEPPALALAEAERRAAPGLGAAPDRWEYLWYLGPAEIYRPCTAPDGRAAIGCHTHGDAGILHLDARLPLVRGTRLGWSWRVDELPTDLPEDSLPSHEYMSIAVEFDDGQDITYFWSSTLPVGTGFGCPLPNWTERETHLVVRSGPAGLGRWLDEDRDLHADYAKYIGGPAREVVRVWLIANSIFTRGHGRCEYAGIRLEAGGRKIEVL